MTDIDTFRLNSYDQLPMRVIKKTPFSTYVPQTYGMIVYAANTNKWLLIQRRHSISFLTYLKGNFSSSKLPGMFRSMTREEILLIEESYTSKDNTIKLVSEMYKDNSMRYISRIWDIIVLYTGLIKRLIDKYRDTTNRQQWLWPKGFKQSSCYKEEAITAAMREFKEESGINEITCPYTVSYETITYDKMGINGYTYSTRCWVMIIAEELPLPDITDKEIEVKDRGWFSKEDVTELLDQDVIHVFDNAVKMTENILSITKR